MECTYFYNFVLQQQNKYVKNSDFYVTLCVKRTSIWYRTDEVYVTLLYGFHGQQIGNNTFFNFISQYIYEYENVKHLFELQKAE